MRAARRSGAAHAASMPSAAALAPITIAYGYTALATSAAPRGGQRSPAAAQRRAAQAPQQAARRAVENVLAGKLGSAPAQAVAAVRALGDVGADLRSALLANHEQIRARGHVRSILRTYRPGRRASGNTHAMTLGHDEKLYILAFDHRGSFQKKFFGIEGEPDPEQTAIIADAKHLLFEGMMQAIAADADPSVTGVLGAEQFGSDVPQQARAAGLRLALPADRSGQELFDFQYGEDF